MLSVDEQLHIILSGVDKVVPVEELKNKLAKGKPLTIKLGVDPTSPDLHLGHAVTLRKLRQFQDLGHNVVLIIGDGTALIGDPSGKNVTRPQLTRADIEKNEKTYVEQAMHILDPEKTRVAHNADWILSLDLEKLLSILSNFTVARILERDDFMKRYKNQTPIALHEFLYPVLQAYDSVQIKADVEMGGRDQLFNLLAGRDLMQKLDMEPQVALMMPLLEGTDGTRKMSKSYGNYVGFTDEPNDMFGKIMSIPDKLVAKYYRLASTLPVEKVDEIEKALAVNEADPYQLKRELASNICDLYHGEGSGKKAQEHFDSVFKKHDIPDDIEQTNYQLNLNDEGKVYMPGLLKDLSLAPSTAEARRLIDGAAVKINGEALDAKSYNVDPALVEHAVIQVGKRRFIKLV